MSIDAPAPLAAAGLTIIVPTFRERGNVAALYQAVSETLAREMPDVSWEIIFVDDDSDDGTGDAVRAVSLQDRRVRLIERVGRRGLSSAVVEGAQSALFDIVLVMDGDLQHDPKYVPQLFQPVARAEADLSAASRFLAADGADGLSSAGRKRQSQVGNGLIRALFGLSLTDPLTGFFCVRRKTVVATAPRLSKMGFKILLDLLVTAEPKLKVREIPFAFAKRLSGDSKLDARVLYDFLLFLMEKRIPGVSLLSTRFVSFGMVGATGVFVHLAFMSAAIALIEGRFGSVDRSEETFVIAQSVGAAAAMLSNFVINNALTYRDKRLSGIGFFRGLLIFAALSSVGLVANVGAANAVNTTYQLNWSIAAIAGILVGIVWNYGTTRRLVWRD